MTSARRAGLISWSLPRAVPSPGVPARAGGLWQAPFVPFWAVHSHLVLVYFFFECYGCKQRARLEELSFLC